MTDLSNETITTPDQWIVVVPHPTAKRKIVGIAASAGVCVLECDDYRFVSAAKDLSSVPGEMLSRLRGGIHSNPKLQDVYDALPVHLANQKVTFTILQTQTLQQAVEKRNIVIAELRDSGKNVLNVR